VACEGDWNYRTTNKQHTLIEHRPDAGMGRGRYMNVSKVTDFVLHVRHMTVDLNWPWQNKICFC